MSEETGNETPEITPEQVEAAKELLTTHGLNVLDQDAFSKRLAKERAKPERDLEALRSDFEKLKESHSELRQFRKDIEDKDKSEIELWEGRQQEWEKADRKRLDELESLKKELDSEKTRNNQFRVNLKLRELITDPINMEAALMWAEAKIPGLAIGETGELTFTEPTGVTHEGPAAEKIVKDWWAKQEDFHRGKTPGPNTKGSPKAPPSPSNEYQSPDGELVDRLKYAQRHNPVKYPV